MSGSCLNIINIFNALILNINSLILNPNVACF